MRIIHIINSLGVGGAETALLRLCKETQVQNIHNAVFYIYGDSGLKNFFIENGIEVFCLSHFSDWIKILKHQRNPDLLMAWLPLSHLLSLFLKIILNAKKLVWNVRQTLNRFDKLSYFTQKFIILASYFSKYTDAIIYNSNQGKVDHNANGYHSAVEKNIYNGFSSPDEQSLRDRSQTRVKLNISDKDFAILFVGRDHPDKGVEDFLNAAFELLKLKPNVYYLMIGKGFEEGGRRHQEIPSQFQSHFRFLGVKNEKDLKFLYAAGDIFTSSSISEGFSNVLGEAMSYGLIPVATDVGDSKNIVLDSGFIIQPRETAAIVESWVKIVSSESAQLANLKNKCKERIKNNFSLTTTTDNYLKLYNLLAREHA